MNAVKIAETAMRTRYAVLSFGMSFTSLDLLIAVKIINAMKYANPDRMVMVSKQMLDL